MSKQDGKAAVKAVAYVRVSTAEQCDHGVSLSAQLERIEAYCTLQGLELVETFHDNGIAGANPLHTREGGLQLLNALADGKAAHVVSLKLDRLFRDAVDCLETSREWDKAGITLHLIDMGGQTLNTGSAMGRLFFTMNAGFAELERNLISVGTQAHKKTHHEAYSPAPLGSNVEDGHLHAEAGEMDTVKRIHAMKDAGYSLRAIAETLNEEGVKTERGGVWHASTIRYALAKWPGKRPIRGGGMSQLLTVQEAAQRLKLNPATVRLWVRKGRIPAMKISGYFWRIREADLEEWIRQHMQAEPGDTDAGEA